MGYEALNHNTTGEINSAFGVSSLVSNISGNQNTAFGDATLSANISGNQNTAIGCNSLQDNIGSANTGCGYASGFHNTSGINNVAIGYQAIFNNTIGSNIVAIGYDAMVGAIVADGTVGIGSGVLSFTTGVGNTAIGYQAGQFITSGINNVLIGYSSGSTIATGTGNTIIGELANVSAVDGIDQIAIGRNAVCTANNCVQLGQSVNSGTSATLNFRSQIISSESWIGGGSSTAMIDNGGNITRGAGGTTVERINTTGQNPSVLIQTTFIDTTGTLAASTLNNGTTDGFVKYLILSAFTNVYTLTVVSGISSTGGVIHTLTFNNRGQSAELIWDNVQGVWFILPTGVTVA